MVERKRSRKKRGGEEREGLKRGENSDWTQTEVKLDRSTRQIREKQTSDRTKAE